MNDAFTNPFLENDVESDDPFANPFLGKENDVFSNPFLNQPPTEPLSPPVATGGDSSLSADRPSVDLSTPIVPPQAMSYAAIDDEEALKRQELAAAEIAAQPMFDEMPSVFNPAGMTPQQLEEYRVNEIMKQGGPTVEKANLNMNPSVSGVSGVPGNYSMNIAGMGDVPVDDATAATAIAKANTAEMPNNAVVRGFGRLENVINVLGQQMGLRSIPKFIEKRQELDRLYPDAPKEIQDGLQAITEAETWADTWKAMRGNWGAVLSVAGESLPQMLPGLVAATGATLVGGPMAGAATIGASSGAIEFGNVLDEEIAASGVDPNDSDALAELMSNEEFWVKARDRGVRRGVPIALFDALSFGVAGKLVGFTRARTSSAALTGAAAGGELIAQGGLGSIGETAAQLAERQGGYRDRLGLGEIALEGVAEFVPGSVEATIQTFAKDATTVEAQQAIRELEKLDLSEANFNAAMEALTPKPMSFEDEIRDLAARMRAIGEDGQADAYLTWLNRKDQVRPRTLPFLRERVVEFERRAAGLEPLKPRDENVFERFVVQNEREREQYEAAMQDPRTRPFMEQMAKEMQMLSDRMYELGYHIDDIPKRMNRMPPEIQKAYSFFSNGGSAMRLIKKLNSNLKGYKGRLQVTDEDLVREISRMEQVVGRNPMPQIGDAPTNPTVSQSLPQPNTPTVGESPVPPTVNSQTVDAPTAPPEIMPPSAPVTPTELPTQPQPATVQEEAPTQPEPPKPVTPPTVQEQPSAPTVPDQPAALPNPQEAEEVGTDVDNVIKTVQTPDGQKNYNVKGKVVELADLKAAQGELQPRDRSRKESDALAKERAGTMFNPARLLDDPTSGSGAPIIARDGTVMSGNGRVLTMQEVYANQPDSLARYRSALSEAGINTEGFEQPVFVRQLTDDMTLADLREFADLSNTEAQAQMSMTERASRDATRLTDSGIIDLYRGDFEIGSAQNREFVQEYAKKILSPTEQGAFVDSNGVVSQEGISRVRNAILASAFDNPDTLATMLESSDENIKAISNAFMATAPKFSQLKKQIADGRTDAQFDITPQLADMANLVSRLRRDGVKLQDYYNQADMLSQPDPDVKELVKAFFNENLSRARSGKAMKDFLTFYADEALQKESGGLIPDETTAADIIDAGRQKAEDKANAKRQEQGGLDFQVSSNVESNDAGRKQVQKRTNAGSRKRVREESAAENQVDETTAPESGVEGVAELQDTESVTPDKAETREDNTRGTKAGRVTIATSETLRQSLYRSAFRDAGLDPDQAVNLSIQRQYRVLSDLVQKKFGLNSIEAPRQGVGYDQVNALLDAYHNLQWMTHTMALPNEAIGLEGSLALALPQRQWGGYNAAYAQKELGPSNFQSDINPASGPLILMPRRSNSFAHEWGHALDYHLMDKLGTEFKAGGITGRIRGNIEKGGNAWVDETPSNLVEAMGDLMNAMFFDEAALSAEIMQLEHEIARLQAKQDRRKSGKPIKKLADLKAQLDRVKSGTTKKRIGKSQFRKDVTEFTQRNMQNEKYWAKPTEMFARAFEAYVARNVAAAGGYNEFITQGDEAYALTMDKVEGADDRLALTYPNDEDRMRIFLAMDRLMDELRASVITEGTPAKAPGDTDMIDAQALFMQSLDISKQEKIGLIEDQKRTYRAHVAQRKRISERPKRYGSTWQMFQDTAGANLINSKRGYLYILADRYKGNRAANRMIESIIAKIAPDPGSTNDRVTAEGGAFEEAVRGASRRYSAVLADLITKHRLNEYTDREMRHLRLYLTSDQTTQALASEEVKRAAGDLRNRLLNPMYDYMRKNGLNANYLPDGGYMPRMMDSMLVIDSRDDFLYGGNNSKRGAKPLYADVIYENEYGTLDPTDAEQAKALINLSRRAKIAAYLEYENPVVAEQANEMRKLLDRIDEESAKLDDPEVDPGEVELEIENLQEQLEELHAEVYEGLRDPYAQLAAEDWYDRITARSVGDISRHGVQGDFAKSRKLPPEADTYMVEFYLNPVEALMQYVPGVVRKVEFEKRFGTNTVPKGQRRKVSGTSIDPAANVHNYMSWASEKMAQAGMKEVEIRNIQQIVDVVTGTGTRYDGSGSRLINAIHSYGTMALLPRAVISSVVEPMTVAIQSGKVLDGFRLYGNMLDEAFTSIRGENARQRKQYYKQLANILGVVDLPEVGQMIANRVGGTAEEDNRNAARVGRFFVNTGLVGLTNSQRRGSMRIGIQYISEIGKQYKYALNANERERAREVLQDFGVRPDDMKQFADYAASLDMDEKGLYEIDLILDRSGELTDMGEILALATRRFADGTIQDPKTIDRPMWAEHPIGRIVFGIQSFIAAFQRNVIIATGKRIAREQQKRGAAAATGYVATRVALPVMGLLASHAILSGVREALLNPEKWEEEKEADNLAQYLTEMTITRSGALGRLDPLYNAFTSLKYQADLTNMLAGASGSYYAKGVQRLMTPFVRNSPNTVSAEYQALRGGYDLAVPTVLSYIASDPRLGRALGPLAGAAAAVGTSPAVKHWVLRNVIYQMYGEEYRPGRGNRQKKKKADNKPSWAK